LGCAGDIGGFHHDGPVAPIPLLHADADAENLFVFVSQHVEVGNPDEAVFIDLQNERHSVLSLTPAECLRLSDALLEAASVVTYQEAANDSISARARVHV
jgi:hypothetical protein